MVSETRSGRRMRNDVDDSKLQKKVKTGNDAQSCSTGKDDTSGVRKLDGEAPLSGHTTPSPQSTHKSKSLEKGTPLSTAPATRKSERLKKHSTPSPLKGHDRGSIKLSPSLDSKQSAKELSFSGEEREKVKNLSQVVMESEKAQVQSESVDGKRKKMTARIYKGLLKRQSIEEIVSDIDGEFEGPDTLSVDATVMDNVVAEPLETPDGDGLQDSRASPNVKETFNSYEFLPRNSSSTTVNSPQSESSTCLARLRDDAVHSESAPEDTPQPSELENNILSRVCIVCSKSKRISSDSPENELCSCEGTGITDVGSSLICKDRGDHIAAVMLESAEKCDSKNLLEKPHSEDQIDGNENVCNISGEILCCEEKGSKRPSRFIDGSTSRFLEYWLPVKISNHQLEQYCGTLLSNASSLRSCSKNDPVGALQKILPSVRKCCDHPYLDDLSVQERLIAEGHTAAEVLEIGIQASGKLQLLDMMLAEIKTQRLQVLILFQLIVGSGRTGDILDDFLRQRFGEHSYERIDAGITPSRKQAAVNRFNKKEKEQFVLLIENRACSSIVKLLSVDIVIIYDSDWNPVNDLRALQRLSFESKVQQIKVLRLYSICTVEERALLFAKQNVNIDNSMQTSSRGATSDNLLMWGASHLFSRLDEFHDENTSALDNSSEQLLLTEVIQELRSILTESCVSTVTYSVITKVKFDVGRYVVNTPLLGEAKVWLKEGEEPHVFWRNLLDRKIPQWKYLSAPSPRHRKRVQYFDGSPGKLDSENDDVGKKRRRALNENVDPASVQVELGEQATQVAGPEGGSSTIIACNQSQSFTPKNNPNHLSNIGSVGAKVDALELEESVALFCKQKSLHSFLQGEMTRLCQILRLSEDVTLTVKRFLEYVIKNHSVSCDSPVIMQSFQLSLCWVAGSISKHELDRKKSLILVQQHLNYQCTEEQVDLVYSKMQSLERMYLERLGNTIESDRDGLVAEGNTSKEQSHEAGSSLGIPFQLKNVKNEIEEKLANEEPTEGQILLQKKLALKDIGPGSEIENKIKQIEKKCSKRMKKLIRKQKERIAVFHQTWEMEKLKLEKDQKLESALIRSLYGQGSVRMDKLKRLDDEFAKKLEEHHLLRDARLKDLEAEHLAALNEERRKATHWRTQAVSFCAELRASNGPQSLGSQLEDYVGCSQSEGNDMIPLNLSISAPSEAVGCDASVETSNNTITINCPNDTAERSQFCVVEQLNQSKLSMDVVEQLHPLKLSSDTADMVSEKTPASEGGVPYDTQSVEPNKEVPVGIPETVLNENLGHVHPMEFSNASNNGYDKGDADSFADTVVGQRDCNDKTTTSSLSNIQLQDQDGPAIEHQSSSQSANSEHVDTVNPVQSIMEQQVGDAPAVNKSVSLPEVAISGLVNAVTPVPSVPSNTGVPALESCEQVDQLSVEDSPSYHLCPAVEIVHQNSDQGRDSSLSAEVAGTDMLSHESNSQSRENLEMMSNTLDLRSLNNILQDNVVVSQAVANEVEAPAVMQLGIDTGPLLRSSDIAHPTHQTASWNSTLHLFTEPLQNELERIRKEKDHLRKSLEDMASQLKADCEKEIQKKIQEIRNTYEMKLRDAKADIRLKENELEKNHNKALVNKVLAEAFRSKCLNLRPPGLPGMQQGMPSSFIQQLQQQSVQPSVRVPLGASTFQTSSAQQNAMHRIPMPHSARASSPVAVQNVMPPGLQHVQAAGPFSGTPSRPPLIGSITPARNPRVGGDIRSVAPHLQPFRPSAASSVSQQRPSQPTPPLHPPAPSVPAPPISQPQSTSQCRSSLSALGLLMEMDQRPRNRTFSPLPEICSTFSSLEPSDLETLGNVQGNHTSSADVVCLSDDE